MNRKFLALSVASVLALGSAQACGPDFQIMLTTCGMRCLGQIRIQSLRQELSPVLAAVTGGVSESEPAISTTEALEHQSLSPAQQMQLTAMRSAASGDAAYQIGAGLPEAARLYTSGAVDFLAVHTPVDWSDGSGSSADQPQDVSPAQLQAGLSAAIARFQAVTALPAEQARPRLLWAEYMLGRAYRLRAAPGDLELAQQHYTHAVSLVKGGMDDPLRLGNAALGELGALALERGNLEQAAALYAQQASSPASEHGINSLIAIMRRLASAGNPNLRADMADPLLQKLLVTYVVAEVASTCDLDSCIDEGGVGAPIIDALESLDSRQIVVPDLVAALAYKSGNYDFAASTVALSHAPMGDWVRAKLALHRGSLDEADADFARAAPYFPSSGDAHTSDVGERLQAEWAAMKLARGDYIDALDQLLRRAGAFQEDIAYIAERVLTLEELKHFVDARPQCGSLVHDILAARLARAGRYADAIPYYSSDQKRHLADSYRQSIETARHARSATARAQAWASLGQLDITAGMDLIGAALDPDGGLYAGDFGANVAPSELAGSDERARVAASAIEPHRRFHYRAIAVRHFELAAAQLPRRSLAASAELCQGAHLLRHHGETPDGDLVKALYADYQRLGKPIEGDRNFGAECPAVSLPLQPAK